MPLLPLRFSALRQLAKSPAHYAAYLQQETAPTSAMDIGTASDLLILGGQRVVSFPGPVRRGKVYDAFSLDHADALILTEKEYRAARGIADAVQSCDDAVRLLTGVRQDTIYWENNGRLCRGTPDVRASDGFHIVDLKTGQTSDPRQFLWTVKRFAYHAAAAWYLAGLNAKGFGVRESYIVAVEQTPPHVVTIFKLTDHLLEMGHKLWVAWFEQLQVCEASGHFPPYAQSIVDLDWPDDEAMDVSDAFEVVESTI